MVRRTFAWLAFGIVLGLSATSAAAPVDVYVLGTHSPDGYGIYVSPAPDVGDISLYVEGFSGRTLMPLPQISVFDSPFVGGPLGATVQIISLPGQNLVPETGGPTDLTLLAMLTYVGFPVILIHSGDDTFGFTVLNRALTEPIPYRLYVEDNYHQIVLVDSWLPEPATTALVGLGLAALSFARRAA